MRQRGDAQEDALDVVTCNPLCFNYLLNWSSRSQLSSAQCDMRQILMLRVSPNCPSKTTLRASGQSKAYVDNGDNRRSCPYPFPFDASRGVSVLSRDGQVIEVGTASDETGMSGVFREGSFAQDR